MVYLPTYILPNYPNVVKFIIHWEFRSSKLLGCKFEVLLSLLTFLPQHVTHVTSKIFREKLQNIELQTFQTSTKLHQTHSKCTHPKCHMFKRKGSSSNHHFSEDYQPKPCTIITVIIREIPQNHHMFALFWSRSHWMTPAHFATPFFSSPTRPSQGTSISSAMKKSP